jgi:hypothetical protein
MFPFDMKAVNSSLKGELESLSDRLNASLQDHSEIRTRNQKATGLVHLQTFFVGKSKAIIDEIDRVLAKIIGLDEEEADQIINYDIKYRMGADGDDAD